MLRKRLQLGLIHVAVAMTLVPINSTLNRVMIKELAISATLVAALASLPYLFSPIQVVTKSPSLTTFFSASAYQGSGFSSIHSVIHGSAHGPERLF